MTDPYDPDGSHGFARTILPASPGRTRTKIRVFVASPGDVLEERNRLTDVIAGLNRGYADDLGLTVELLRWETHVRPDVGRPQQLVFDDLPVGTWDIFIGVLWLRFGSPSGAVDDDTGAAFGSGTEEEFRAALGQRAKNATGWPKVMFYRCTRPPDDILSLDGEQWGRVQHFFREFSPDGAHPGLVAPFNDVNEFERLVREHLEVRLKEFARARGLAIDEEMDGPQQRWAARRDDRAVLEEYVRAVIRDNDELQPGGIKQIKVQVNLPLDDIYVSLRGERDRPDIDRRVMQDELDEIKQRLMQFGEPEERERQYEVYARDVKLLESALLASDGDRQELTDIVGRQTKLVLVGDPGSGKTTLLRWLALRHARAVLESIDRIFEPQQWWTAPADVWRAPGVGPVRLPILLRIARYAEARNPAQGGDRNLSLLDYLPRYFEGMQIPDAHRLGPILAELLERGRCLIMLDGLDEIIDYADRRDIAENITRFAGAFGDKGFPDWLRTPGQRLGQPYAKRATTTVAGDDDWDVETIAWDRRMPHDQQVVWKARLSKLRGSQAWDKARELLYQEHVGNNFVVTSRRAGYSFAPVGGAFDLYTIREMDEEDIERFLRKWCPAVEAKVGDPNPVKIEQRAQREIEGILKALKDSPGVRRMAGNPLLLRILAIVHRNERHLPQRRAELYETATITLLRDWQLERGARGAVIDETQAMSLLGPVAFWMHENRASAHVERAQVLRLMGSILAKERGMNPDDPPAAVRRQVAEFLDVIRQHSGLFIERGEGLYGFMHLTFEEYFTARQMISDPARVHEQILRRLHQPRWREPILLAVGLYSKTFFQGTEDLLTTVLNAGSEYESVLHRDLFFVAACVGDSVNVPHRLRTMLTRTLLAIQADRSGAGRYRALQAQVRDALATLSNDSGDTAVEEALAEAIRDASDRSQLAAVLDTAEWLGVHTSTLADGLDSVDDAALSLRAQRLAGEARARASGDNGWNASVEDDVVAVFLGALVLRGWGDALGASVLGVASQPASSMAASLPDPPVPAELAVDHVREILEPVDAVRPIGIAEDLIATLESTLDESALRRAADLANNLYFAAPLGTALERIAMTFEPDRDAAEDFVNRLRVEVERLHASTDDIDSAALLGAAGQTLMRETVVSDALADVLRAAAARFVPPYPYADLRMVRETASAASEEFRAALGETMRTTTEPQLYNEAGLLLGRGVRPEGPLDDELAVVLLRDLEGADEARRWWSLQLLSRGEVSRHVALQEQHRQRLLALIDGAPGPVALVLEVLFAYEVDAALLARCWTILRDPASPFARLVGDRIDGVPSVRGEVATLAELDRGLHDPLLRRPALDLLTKVEWAGEQSFGQAVVWLIDADADVRHRSAILLAKQGELSTITRSMAAAATRELDTKKGGATGLGPFLDDPAMIRLLRALWASDHVDQLTQLVAGLPFAEYASRVEPELLWAAPAEYAGTADIIAKLLEQDGRPQAAAAAALAQAAGLLAERDPGDVSDQPADAAVRDVADFLSQRLADSPETAQFAEPVVLRRSLADPSSSTRRWVADRLRRRGLSLTSHPGELSPLLTERDQELRTAAAIALMVANLPLALAPVLLDATAALDDRVRSDAAERLAALFDRPINDEDDGPLLNWLYDRVIESAGYQGTVLADAATSLVFKSPYWPLRWLDEVGRPEEEQPSRAIWSALRYISDATPEVLEAIFRVFVDARSSEAVVDAAAEILERCMSRRDNVDLGPLTDQLVDAMNHPSTAVAYRAAHLVGIARRPRSWEAASTLLAAAHASTDPDFQTYALDIICNLLQQVHDKATDKRDRTQEDTSTTALLQWLETNALSGLDVRRRIAAVLDIPTVSTGDEALELLGAVRGKGVAEPNGRLPSSGVETWEGLLEAADQEWRLRRRWRETWAGLDALAVDLRVFLSHDNAEVALSAAAALAATYEPDDRIALMRTVVAENTILPALLRGIGNSEVVRSQTFSHEYPSLVASAAAWVIQRTPAHAARLVADMLDDVEQEVESSDYSTRWSLIVVLAAVSEQLTLKVFTSRRSAPQVIDLFARLANDPKNFDIRKLAVRVIGNLQHFTELVGMAFFAACRDVDAVSQESRAAVGKFKFFAPGSLEWLVEGVRGADSAGSAYHAALLLGELGLRRSEELGHEGRKLVADQLVLLLADPSVERDVHLFSGSDPYGPVEVLRLYDVVFETMLRVVSGPDAPVTPPAAGVAAKP